MRLRNRFAVSVGKWIKELDEHNDKQEDKPSVGEKYLQKTQKFRPTKA